MPGAEKAGGVSSGKRYRAPANMSKKVEKKRVEGEIAFTGKDGGIRGRGQEGPSSSPGPGGQGGVKEQRKGASSYLGALRGSGFSAPRGQVAQIKEKGDKFDDREELSVKRGAPP